MTTYFTDDFADFSTDWTLRYNTSTSGDYTLTSGNILWSLGKSNDWCNVSWNDLDSDSNRANVELLFKFTTGSSTAYCDFAFMRGSGADEAVVQYTWRYSSANLIAYYCNGADTATSISSVSTGETIAASTTYWARVRVNGSTIQGKLWKDGNSEPDWHVNTTDSTISAAGWIGLSRYHTQISLSAWTLLQIGVGTNGDTAPASSGAATYALPPMRPASRIKHMMVR